MPVVTEPKIRFRFSKIGFNGDWTGLLYHGPGDLDADISLIIIYFFYCKNEMKYYFLLTILVSLRLSVLHRVHNHDW